MTPLRRWQQRNLPALRQLTFEPALCPGVTLIAYTFPTPENEAAWFAWLEAAILQSWRTLGLMKTVIVAHAVFPAVDAFCKRWPNAELQIEPSLVPGDIWSMSRDCIARLATRFNTPHCLIVQDDGFPIGRNLGDFLKWDYIGAPFVRDLPRQHLANLIGISTGIGGFSLRSRRLCRAAARQWERGWSRRYKKGSWWFSEDIFYAVTLRLFAPRYRIRHRFPTARQAAAFAIDSSIGRFPATRPFGFHGCETFAFLKEKGWVPDDLE